MKNFPDGISERIDHFQNYTAQCGLKGGKNCSFRIALENEIRKAIVDFNFERKEKAYALENELDILQTIIAEHTPSEGNVALAELIMSELEKCAKENGHTLVYEKVPRHAHVQEICRLLNVKSESENLPLKQAAEKMADAIKPLEDELNGMCQPENAFGPCGTLGITLTRDEIAAYREVKA